MRSGGGGAYNLEAPHFLLRRLVALYPIFAALYELWAATFTPNSSFLTPNSYKPSAEFRLFQPVSQVESMGFAFVPEGAEGAFFGGF